MQHPNWFDVVVASNLFGDILSDLGPAVVGGKATTEELTSAIIDKLEKVI